MIQNQQELLRMIAAGTVTACDGVEHLHKLSLQPNTPVESSRIAVEPTQITSPQQTLSRKQFPWLFIQVPIKNL